MTRNDAIRIGAPLIAAGAVWLAQRAVATGYKKAVGSAPPQADDLDAPITGVLLFAAGAAMVAAVVQVVINREVARATAPKLDQAVPVV